MIDDDARLFASSALGPTPGIEALGDWDADRCDWQNNPQGFRHWLVVQVIGGPLPHWIQVEQQLPTSAVWHLMVVRELQTCAAAQTELAKSCRPKWRIVLLPCETSPEAVSCEIGHAHLILTCDARQIDSVAEDLAHLILRHSYMGVSTNEIIGWLGMREDVTVSGTACILLDFVVPAAKPLLAGPVQNLHVVKPTNSAVCGIFTTPALSFTILDVENAISAVLRDVGADTMLVKGVMDAPRTEILIMTV